MRARTRRSLIALPIIFGIGAAIAWAGSQNGLIVAGWPLFALCGAIAFGLNGLVFLHANAAKTERFYDLTGSLTYLSVVGVAVAFGNADPRALLLGMLICIWAARLGSFLFIRITKDGSDGRFDEIKVNFANFLMTWMLQGLWVLLTASCALAAMTSAHSVPLGPTAVLGAAIWAFGFGIEVVADRQKSRFRADPSNAGRFIKSGLWSWSRHPNYFGEIVLWIGVAVVAVPALAGWQLATLISPIFVIVLLTKISGIPLLEARAQKKWGEDADFQEYTRRTSVLIPRPPAAA
jgi:steroid 5-alpha reductase family enzyme